jgi:hypothetical protein
MNTVSLASGERNASTNNMRKMKIETTIANLKKMHESYKDEVEHAQKEFVAIATKLNKYQELVAQTERAILALEGGPVQVAPKLFENYNNPQTVVPGLPPPEPGMVWAQNELQEWVLIPIVLNAAQNANLSVPQIELPPIDEDEKFTDKPTDFVI